MVSGRSKLLHSMQRKDTAVLSEARICQQQPPGQTSWIALRLGTRPPPSFGKSTRRGTPPKGTGHRFGCQLLRECASCATTPDSRICEPLRHFWVA